MKKNLFLSRGALIAIVSALLGVSVLTTTVLANSDTLSVRADVLNVRLGPGLSYNVMGQVGRGSSLTVISQKNSWYQVRLAGNRVGWVASWLVDHNAATTTAAKVGVVKSPVNVRQYAKSSATLLGTLTAGNSVKVLYNDGNWSQIEYNGGAGWIEDSYITLTGATSAVVSAQTKLKQDAATTLKVHTNTATSLRETGGINARVIETLPKNTELTVLNQDGEWYHVRTQNGKTGFIASWVVSTPSNGSTTKAATSLAEATIVIDPGHGGSDSGAESADGQHYEKTYTLAVANKVAAQLRAAGANVVMTRTNDSYVDLSPRPTLAAKLHADAFISFHFDSTEDPNTASGHTTYYYSKSKDEPLAKSLSGAMSGLGVANRGVEFGNFEVLRDNTQPAVLLEMGYINSKKDFKHIQQASYQDAVANDVRTGLNQYFESGHHQ
ncbi:N-acetylmuramoyl-L-alanine amidase [Lacticaseibacillus pabuli]|uniref:N-acetylmuramoyl-L-alanine amidase n=1 Tax=Lacticaseibacillus pabuli TaxID=3025672 RepID=A0ABY7WUD3_9LACO|nr:N-acetylmuramoyl-L-alanine amidase [Lacticaseibacillus sp. KACC 23028]WDF83778.1 N-acetylmuramoyl-L-alanine amidase [Lacticaseibacillus sp. KACC 23028]